MTIKKNNGKAIKPLNKPAIALQSDIFRHRAIPNKKPTTNTGNILVCEKCNELMDDCICSEMFCQGCGGPSTKCFCFFD